jgi:hypothetical protein
MQIMIYISINLDKYSELRHIKSDPDELQISSTSRQISCGSVASSPRKIWIDDIPFPDKNSSLIGWF